MDASLPNSSPATRASAAGTALSPPLGLAQRRHAVFAIYLPPQAGRQPGTGALLARGLTCTDENFMQKAGAQRIAAELGVAIVAPDTSPRGAEVPGDPDGAWDFGHGAGFYLNASEPLAPPLPHVRLCRRQNCRRWWKRIFR